jgi:hypothetical protein
MNIAGEVLSRKNKARLSKYIVEFIMLRFKNNTQKIPDILDLYGDNQDEIRILCNSNLNRQLMKLAGILSSYITKANGEIIKKVNHTMEQQQQ